MGKILSLHGENPEKVLPLSGGSNNVKNELEVLLGNKNYKIKLIIEVCSGLEYFSRSNSPISAEEIIIISNLGKLNKYKDDYAKFIVELFNISDKTNSIKLRTSGYGATQQAA